MATENTIPFIIEISKICQVLTTTDRAKMNAMQGGFLDERLPQMLYMERKAVEWTNTYNSSNPNLRQMANYLWGLCWGYAGRAQTILNNLSQTISISNPSNQNVTVGNNATFSVTVTSSLAYTIQWFLNGVAIPGATSLSYTFTNAQLVNSGDLFSATATSAAGTASSTTALLTVTSALVGYYYYSTTNDYSTQLESNVDVVPYLGTFNITSGQPLTNTFPIGAENCFFVIKYPATESIKTTYANAPINNGSIPSIAWNAILTFGGWNYIFTRTGNVFALNYLAPLIFS